jgi:short-subunit dehydrogenase
MHSLADVSSIEQLTRALDRCVAKLGTIDVLVLNAGVSEFKSLAESNSADIDRAIDVNFRSAVHASAYVCRLWSGESRSFDETRARLRSLIFVSSISALKLSYPLLATYVSTKQALIGLGYATFEDVRASGARVHVISPGLVNTELGADFAEQYFRGQCALDARSMIQVDDVADAAEYCLGSSDRVVPIHIVIEPQLHTRRDFEAVAKHREATTTAGRSVAASSAARKTALVTGASQGVGRACALALAARGYDVALLARNTERLEAVADECRQAGSARALVVSVDVYERSALEAAVHRVGKCFGGRIDVLVSNAGVNRRKSVLRANGSDVLERVVDINLIGAMIVSRVALAYMGDGSSIVFVGSTAARSTAASAVGTSAYYASKFGLLGFSNVLLEDVRHLGIKVTHLLPSLIDNALGTRPGPEPYGFPTDTNRHTIRNEDMAGAVLYAIDCSRTACVTQIHLYAQLQHFSTIRHIASRL